MLRKRVKIKVAHVTIWLRRLTEVDYLSIAGAAGLFSVVRSHRDPLDIQGIVNDIDSDKAKFEADDKREIILKSTTRFKNKTGTIGIEEFLESHDVVNMVYLIWVNRSFPRCGGVVNNDKAIQIYDMYKGMNFAKEYFSKKLCKVEEFSFNSLIYSIGRSNEIRREKPHGK